MILKVKESMCMGTELKTKQQNTFFLSNTVFF